MHVIASVSTLPVQLYGAVAPGTPVPDMVALFTLRITLLSIQVPPDGHGVIASESEHDWDVLLLQTLFVPQLRVQLPSESQAIVLISWPAQKQPASIAFAPVKEILVVSKKEVDGVEYVHEAPPLFQQSSGSFTPYKYSLSDVTATCSRVRYKPVPKYSHLLPLESCAISGEAKIGLPASTTVSITHEAGAK